MGNDLRPREHVVRRGGRWYYRRRIPQDLLDQYPGKVEFLESLRTAELAEANRRAALRTLEHDQEFAHKRALKAAQPEESLTDEEVNRIAKLWGAEALDMDDYWRARGFIFGAEGHREGIDHYLPDWKEAYSEGNIVPALEWTRTELARHGIKLNEKSSSFRVLALAILAESIRVHEIMLARLDGNPIPTPQAQAVVLRGPGRATVRDGATLVELHAYWAKRRDVRAHGAAEAARTVAEFQRINGERVASEYTKADAVNFRDTLLDKALAAGGSAATVRKKMNHLAAIFEVARKSEKVASNPFDGVERPDEKRKRRRESYSIDDLRRIFSSPVFTDSGYRPQGGAGEAAYWLPLLALWTGARLEELGQLHTDDVRRKGAIDYLSLKPDAAGSKKFKNENSQRDVPLHAELIRCGFLDYVNRMRKAGSARLFPEVQSSGVRQQTAAFSQWWGRYGRRVAGIADKTKVFHSFRHTFKTACRDSGISDEIHDRFTGHAGGRGEGASYGEVWLTTLARELAKLRYDGLDLSHLHRPASGSAYGAADTGHPHESEATA